MNEPTDDQKPMCKYGVVQPTDEELADPRLLKRAQDELKKPIVGCPVKLTQDVPRGLP